MLIFEYITVQCVLIYWFYWSINSAKRNWGRGNQGAYGLGLASKGIILPIALTWLLIHSIFVRNVSFVRSFIESGLFEKPLFIAMLILIILAWVWIIKIKRDEKNKDNKK